MRIFSPPSQNFTPLISSVNDQQIKKRAAENFRSSQTATFKTAPVHNTAPQFAGLVVRLGAEGGSVMVKGIPNATVWYEHRNGDFSPLRASQDPRKTDDSWYAHGEGRTRGTHSRAEVNAFVAAARAEIAATATGADEQPLPERSNTHKKRRSSHVSRADRDALRRAEEERAEDERIERERAAKKEAKLARQREREELEGEARRRQPRTSHARSRSEAVPRSGVTNEREDLERDFEPPTRRYTEVEGFSGMSHEQRRRLSIREGKRREVELSGEGENVPRHVAPAYDLSSMPPINIQIQMPSTEADTAPKKPKSTLEKYGLPIGAAVGTMFATAGKAKGGDALGGAMEAGIKHVVPQLDDYDHSQEYRYRFGNVPEGAPPWPPSEDERNEEGKITKRGFKHPKRNSADLELRSYSSESVQLEMDPTKNGTFTERRHSIRHHDRTGDGDQGGMKTEKRTVKQHSKVQEFKNPRDNQYLDEEGMGAGGVDDFRDKRTHRKRRADRREAEPSSFRKVWTFGKSIYNTFKGGSEQEERRSSHRDRGSKHRGYRSSSQDDYHRGERRS